MNRKSSLPTQAQLADFCGQMALVLKAGYSLEEALVLLTEDAPGLEPVLQQVRSSGDLAEALNASGALPEYFLRMIHLGQETGRLEDVMQALEDHYRREQALRQSLKDALGYPALMLAMVLVVLCLLLGWVMPLFRQAYAQLGAALTGLPLVLLELGALLQKGGWLVPVLILAAVLLMVRFTGFSDMLTDKLPFFGGIRGKLALSRLTGALALGLSSGLSTHYALELASQLNTDAALAEKLDRCREELNSGRDLADALRTTGILGGSEARLVLVGRRTGSLDTAFSRISQDCREEADQAIDSAIAAIEPVMVALLSLVVAVLMLSVLLPMLGLLSSL